MSLGLEIDLENSSSIKQLGVPLKNEALLSRIWKEVEISSSQELPHIDHFRSTKTSSGPRVEFNRADAVT